MKTIYICILFSVIASCSLQPITQTRYSESVEELEATLRHLVHVIPDDMLPRSFSFVNNHYEMVGKNDWTSGFPAGSFWYMYELTGNDFWKEMAIENTKKLEGIQFLTHTHDLGFMVCCSYGNAYRITGEEIYKNVVVDASESLAGRFNPTVGCIRSWDFGNWQFPVIIDNMMNLEMLFKATEFTGNKLYENIAVSHANVTLKNHFRDNWSSFHVVDYDTVIGTPVGKMTHQGLHDESAWSRGQAWGLYGFTMCYRFTSDEKYLSAAEKIGNFILDNAPADKILYWDFNDPGIPDAPRDASAAAIAASAFFELSRYSQSKEKYLNAANEIMKTLSSSNYKATGSTNGGFILKHCVGHMPASSEVNVALNYADYYYLEAVKRQKELKN